MLSLYNIIATLISWHFNIFTSYLLVFNFTIFTFTNFLHAHTNSNRYYLIPNFKCIFLVLWCWNSINNQIWYSKETIYVLKFPMNWICIYWLCRINLDAKYTFYLIYKLSNLHLVIYSYQINRISKMIDIYFWLRFGLAN